MISKTEYDLCKEIHYRDGEILELRYVKSKQSREIERLNARIHKILEVTPDVQETDQGDQIDKITELENMFEYLKGLLIDLSHKEGNVPIDPDEIDVEYVETVCRYSFPTLFDRRALLGNNDLRKIGLADSILAKFDVKTMAKYEGLVERGDVDVIILDHRCDVVDILPVKGSRDA
jgi:GTP cyclohydrolase II